MSNDDDFNADRSGSAKEVAEVLSRFTPAATQIEPGYDYIKEIASGGYGYVYLFTKSQSEGREYVAGKFVYRDAFGPAADAASEAAYQRAFEGLQNFRSLSTQSEYLLRIFDVRQRHDEGYFCYMMELADDLERRRDIDTGAYRPKTLKNEMERSGKRERLATRRCVEVAIQLARGLHIRMKAGSLIETCVRRISFS